MTREEIEKCWLKNQIIDFLIVLEHCMTSTTFEKDKPVFRDDIINATNWLIRLNKGESHINIAKDIIDSQTSKVFTDYWRNGVWGEEQGEALYRLQKNIKKYFNIEKEW